MLRGGNVETRAVNIETSYLNREIDKAEANGKLKELNKTFGTSFKVTTKKKDWDNLGKKPKK